METATMMKLIVWGTGLLEKTVYNEGINANILGYIECNRNEGVYRGRPIIRVDSLPYEYDMILVAVEDADNAYIIADHNNLDMNKICFLIAGSRYRRFNPDRRIKEVLSERRWNLYLSEYGVTQGSFIEDDEKIYTSMNLDKNFEIDHKYLYPIIGDKYKMNGGAIAGNYFWQDIWGAKRVIQIHKEASSGVVGVAKEHWDIGSSVGGFLAHILSAGVPVNAIDVRPFAFEVEGMKTVCSDATVIDGVEDNSMFSFSALCSIEHFGLGRYGDEINPEAWKECINSIQKKVMEGGHILISVPIGKQRLEFNAHRIFSPKTIVSRFNKSKLLEFDVVNLRLGGIEEDVELDKYDTLDKGYLVGLFHFIKL